MKPIEKELDRLIQQSCQKQSCIICGKKAEAMHHIIGRANMVTRYNPDNLMPVCLDCHRKIHDGKINQWDYIDGYKGSILRELSHKSYKDFLIFVVKQTEDEYLRDLKKNYQQD